MNLGVLATIAYGLLNMIGGIVGYTKAGSKVSIIAGSISGLLLILSGVLQLQGQTWGLVLAAAIAALLVIVFTIRLSKTRQLMPAGLMTLLGVIALGMMVFQLIGEPV